MTSARDNLRARLAARLQAAGLPEAGCGTPPRYDEVYQRGVEWLDSLAGEPWGEVEPQTPACGRVAVEDDGEVEP